jgi:hypothetical protein
MFEELEEENYIGWAEAQALLYGLRPERNTLCHPKINPRRVLAYLDVWRQDDEWDSFFSVIQQRAESEIIDIRSVPLKRRFGGRN